jgi:hypothetical protein
MNDHTEIPPTDFDDIEVQDQEDAIEGISGTGALDDDAEERKP